ncbi:hypothetical protein KLP40_01985 [Hymenobacter sp. NST-14]|uniref:DUF6624 domain-containing protein n=1 Tax=Hymenobacter piscis TaxID=2839984 RepID=UPI001C00E24F|nr:DUF6624 domain-containing protein [Hymenobacter piscis]MBT9391920.1 hypothetical protein [Hymenobacter piscis]
MKTPLIFSLVLLGCSTGASAQTASPRYPALSRTLDSLAYVDQWPMQRMMQQLPDTAGRNLEGVQHLNFARHQPVLEAIIRRYGYPGFREVGETSANNFWLLVQHADAHPDFQRRILQLMQAQVKAKNASPRNYAYLTDRVALAAGRPQEYGTQVEYTGPGIGTAHARTLRDPKNVNKRRAAMGMEPLEEYLRNSADMHRQMNTPQPKAL